MHALYDGLYMSYSDRLLALLCYRTDCAIGLIMYAVLYGLDAVKDRLYALLDGSHAL